MALGRTRGTHARRPERGRLLPLLIAAVVVLALVVVAGLALRGGDDESASGCDGGALTVAASPEIAPTVEQVLDGLAEDEDAGGCTDFTVRAVSSAQAATEISDGRAPDVWIPDSSTWVDKVEVGDGSGGWTEGPSIARSPIVLAVGGDAADDASLTSWSSRLTNDDDLRMANPDSDTASRLAYHASRIGEPERLGLQTGGRLIFLSRFAAPSVNALLDSYAQEPAEADPFPASEQRIFAFAEEHGDTEPLHAVMPETGTLALDYPWISSPDLTGERRDAAEQARTAFGSTQTRDLLTEAGFRSSDGRGGPEIAEQEPAALDELEPLTRQERLAAVEQWDILRTDIRMLALIDVSGSMEWDSPTPGMARWEVTQGALLQGIGILPAGSQVGGWAFSSDIGGEGQDWQELAPVRRLDESVGSGTQRDRLERLVSDGGELIEGDTGLYDSVWAAYQEMQDSYDEDYVNSIVVFTDGENDDPNGGLSLNQLLDRIDEGYDPERPVRIITIGMGEADASALQQISEESGGTSYIAETPDDIERVFVEALLARTG